MIQLVYSNWINHAANRKSAPLSPVSVRISGPAVFSDQIGSSCTSACVHMMGSSNSVCWAEWNYEFLMFAQALKGWRSPAALCYFKALWSRSGSAVCSRNVASLWKYIHKIKEKRCRSSDVGCLTASQDLTCSQYRSCHTKNLSQYLTQHAQERRSVAASSSIINRADQTPASRGADDTHGFGASRVI